MIKFHNISASRWLSWVLHSCNFDYYLIIELRDGVETTYTATLSVVSPEAAGKINCQRVSDMTDPELIADCLHSWGLSVPVWTGDGNNRRTLVEKAKRQALPIAHLFRFYMDKSVYGTTGWQWLRGPQ